MSCGEQDRQYEEGKWPVPAPAELRSALVEVRDDYIATHHFWRGIQTHAALRSRVERDADEHMGLVEAAIQVALRRAASQSESCENCARLEAELQAIVDHDHEDRP